MSSKNKITRYNDLFFKFLNRRSNYSKIINSSNQNDLAVTILEKIDMSIPIFCLHLIGIMNNNTSNNGKSNHSYFFATAVFYMLTILKIKEHYYNNGNYLLELLPIYTIMEIIQNSKTMNLNKNVDSDVLNLTTEILENISKPRFFKNTSRVKKTDITKYNFQNPNTLKKYEKMERIEYNDLITYINETYGALFKYILDVSVIVTSFKNKIPEKQHKSLGFLIKIIEDFMNMEKDINDAIEKYTTNICVNIGIDATYQLYINNKILFIELGSSLDISSTVTAIIDILDDKFNNCLNNLYIDLKTQNSSYS